MFSILLCLKDVIKLGIFTVSLAFHYQFISTRTMTGRHFDLVPWFVSARELRLFNVLGFWNNVIEWHTFFSYIERNPNLYLFWWCFDVIFLSFWKCFDLVLQTRIKQIFNQKWFVLKERHLILKENNWGALMQSHSLHVLYNAIASNPLNHGLKLYATLIFLASPLRGIG